MSTHATGTFEGKSWDEKPYAESDGGRKLVRASVTNVYHGDIEGEGTLEYLMFYPESGGVPFIGMELIVGRIGDRSGSLVLQHDGVYENGTAKATWSVVPGSGTGDLRGLRGQGGFVGEHGQPSAKFTLDYDFE